MTGHRDRGSADAGGSRRGAVLAALALTAASLATGCGGDSDSTAGGIGALVDRLPADSAKVYATDVAAARSDLGLEGDADAIDVEAAFGSGIQEDDPLQRLVRDASTSLPPLAEELAGNGAPPALEALDGGAIRAIASTGPGQIQLSAISTSQDFDEVADALADQGYTRSGDVLEADSPSLTIGGVADAGDGVFVLARSPQLVEEAIGQDSGPDDLAGVAESGDEPIRTAETGTNCIESVGVGQSADAASGSVQLHTAEDADAASLDRDVLETAEPGFEFSEPSVDGPELSVEFSGEAPELGAQTPAETLGQTFSVYSAYKCDS